MCLFLHPLLKVIWLIHRKLFLLILFFGLQVIPAKIFSQDIPKDKKPFITPAFKTGEWLQFRLHYGIFNASYATLSLSNDTIANQPVFHAKGYGRTSGLARLFFRVEDHYESYFNKDKTQPLRFIRRIDEGGYTKNKVIEFDQKNGFSYVNDIKNNKKSRYKIDYNTQDLVSTFYYLRNYLPKGKLIPNQSFKIKIFFDDESFDFNLKYLGIETLKTKFGKIECLKFIPLVQKGRVFKDEESITLWISNDLNKVPIRIQADIAIGSIKCDLENYKNIKYPFKIVSRL